MTDEFAIDDEVVEEEAEEEDLLAGVAMPGAHEWSAEAPEIPGVSPAESASLPDDALSGFASLVDTGPVRFDNAPTIAGGLPAAMLKPPARPPAPAPRQPTPAPRQPTPAP
ncbi:MAG: hypothetical protein AB2A00_31065, partial [Myxococcota bacterium]